MWTLVLNELRIHCSSPLILGETKKFQTKIIGEDLSRKLNVVGELNLRGDLKFYRGAMDPNDAMVVVLKDILLCLLGFRFYT